MTYEPKNEQQQSLWHQTILAGVVGACIAAGVGWIGLTNGWLPGLSASPASVSGLTQNVEVQAIDVADVVERINPAVVSIVITKDVPVMERYYEETPRGPFGDFFRFRVPQYRQNGTEEKEIGGGSGFFISADGYVVTNAHVVSDQEADYTVFTNDEQKYDAKVVAVDDVLDIAVLKVDISNVSYLEFGNSDALRPGQAVIAIGNALGEFRNTVSTGVVSGLSRSITAGDGRGMSEALENVIQTDAAINPGNSGGPLLDLSGHVIGVNVAVAGNSENIGFSLPSNAVKQTVDSIIKTGKIVRPYLGVRSTLVTESLQKKNNLSVDYGALIVRGETRDDLAVIPGSPADKAGLEEYDIILEVDGQKVDSEHSLSGLIRSKTVGQTITLRVLHDGSEKDVQATLEETPSVGS